jgi:uncharacterized protein (TIGR03435 family)
MMVVMGEMHEKVVYQFKGADVIARFVPVLLPAFSLFAQPPNAAPLAFEVASIRPHKGDVLMVGTQHSGPKIRYVALSLASLIGDAYHRERYQISGAQGWMDSDRYDILANAPGETAPSREDERLMLQSLLADRFQLKLHTETRDSSVYALVAAKNGPKLKVSTAGEYSQSVSGRRSALETFAKATMQQLANHLSSYVGRPVLDKTGLPAAYDFTLNWTPDSGGQPNPDLNGVDLFTALQEQLGLKLESQKAPIEMLVIDRAEKPSEN